MKRFLIITLALTLLASSSIARVPQTINVQGVLADDSGITLPDGDYNVFFQIWDLEIDGSDLWGETIVVTQVDGFFNAILGHNEDFDPAVFTGTRWMSMQIVGDSVMEPRIEMTSVVSALSAAIVDRNAAVLSLNGLKNNVNLAAGANVTITQQDSTLTIAATTGAGGDDGDWEIVGSDIQRTSGRIFVGQETKLAPLADPNPDADPTKNSKMPTNSKMEILAQNEGLSVLMQETNTDSDGRVAIYAERESSPRNHGTAMTPGESNAAIMGVSLSGDQYTFAVSAFGNVYYTNSGALLASNSYGSLWSAFAFKDSSYRNWGMYTNGTIHADGEIECGGLNVSNYLLCDAFTQFSTIKVTDGAQAGYIMTSDSSGNATWSAPLAVESDGDWAISGMNLIHSDPGTVAIGTGSAHPLANMPGNTTLQISALSNPGLVLDATSGGLKRWSMFMVGDELRFSKTNDYALLGSTSMSMSEGLLKINDFSGTNKIKLQGEAADSQGGRMFLYNNSTHTTAAAVALEGQTSSSRLGGTLTLRDEYGQEEIIITATHDGTNIGRVTTPILEITGGSDLSEQFDIGNFSLLTKPGMVVSIDPQNPGKLTLSGEAYDCKVAGVISGAGGVNTGMLMGQHGTEANGELPVALVGRVYVWADASSAPIQPGDLLTTSDRPGHAMKVTDNSKAMGAILGKAMTGLTEGQGLILTLISLQ